MKVKHLCWGLLGIIMGYVPFLMLFYPNKIQDFKNLPSDASLEFGDVMIVFSCVFLVIGTWVGFIWIIQEYWNKKIL